MASPTRSPTGSLPLRPQGGLRHNIVEQLRDLKSCMPLREDQARTWALIQLNRL